MDFDQELLDDFVVESMEHIDGIEPLLLEMEREGDADKDTWNSLFRALHSVKGAAGFLGLENIQEISHVSESLLMLLRDGDLAFQKEMVSPLLRVLDNLRSMLELIPGGDEPAPRELISEIEGFMQRGAQSSNEPAAGCEGEGSENQAAHAPAAPQNMGEQIIGEVLKVTNAGQDGTRYIVFEPKKGWDRDAVLSAAAAAGTLLKVPKLVERSIHLVSALGHRELASKLGVPGSCLHVFDPSQHASIEYESSQTGQPGTVLFGRLAVELGFLSDADLEALVAEQESRSERMSIGCLARELGFLTSEQADLVRYEQLLRPTREGVVKKVTESAKAKAPQPAATSKPKEKRSDSIRVQVGLLNKLINLAGELVLGRNQLRQMLENVEVPGLKQILQGVDLVTTELQESILYTRMQPVRILFDRLPRQIRDTASRLGKQVELQVTGAEVELDRSLVEALGDPMTHLIRNAVDHGIESPEERRAAGKSAEGLLNVRAYHESGQVIIEIQDDGKGIDPDRLRAISVSRGIHTQEQADQLSDKEAINLIFHAGLSTAAKVTEVSGRGVGMDVVRNNIKSLGGHVEVDSTVGEGTILRIRLPLTLAIIPSLTVKSSGQRFAIPQVNLVEVVRLRAEDMADRLDHVRGTEVLRLRSELLPLIRLPELLGIEQSEPQGSCNVVVLKAGAYQYGLVVDELCDSEEIVVKPLSGLLAPCYWYAGSTILGDGHVVMILDVQGLLRKSGLDLTEINELLEDEASGGVVDLQRKPSMVIFSNNQNEYFALPQEQIQRLEKIRIEDLRHMGYREYLQQADQAIPLLRLEEMLPVQAPDTASEVGYVLIPRSTDWSVGIFATEIVDTLEACPDNEHGLVEGPGVTGTALLNGRLTVFLDMEELLENSNVERNCHV
ncbi:MAG: chemotaxis protein CheA [Planctomycetes bacterium]|nr:chemotaxis protein CheA [Planctomycetota bacterium]